MRKLAVLAALAIATPAVAEPRTELVGRVLEAKTRKPLEGVFISAQVPDGEPLTTITDHNGLYRFVFPDGGSYKLVFEYADIHREQIVPIDRGKIVTFDGALDIDGDSVIVIRDPQRPVVLPQMVKDARRRIAPPYSDEAIEKDAWTKAWLLLDIDETGTVTRLKFLNRPGYDLEDIAVKQAFKTQFTPALDAKGNPVRTQIAWPIEWPSYWWMVTLEDMATRIPDNIIYKPCRGSGPLQMGSLHPTYRDCSGPNRSRAVSEPWIEARR